MLSRIAESMFWIGRFVERADYTARILDVHLHLVPGSGSDATGDLHSLLATMGTPVPPGPLDARAVIDLLAFDPTNPSSIAASLRAARENARGARETISTEMWECLNATSFAIDERRRAATALGYNPFLTWVEERAALFAGLTMHTMPRDETWQFMSLGSALERVDMTARMLLTLARAEGRPAALTAVLACCGGRDAFLRHHSASMDGPAVAAFLLLDRLFPRSVFFALRAAEEHAVALDELTRGQRGQRGQDGQDDVARRVLGRARAALEFGDPRSLLASMPDHLETLQQTCTLASQAVSARYFGQVQVGGWAAGAWETGGALP